MSVTPAGFYALPMLYLANGLAASEAFQDATSAADAAAAAAFIHYHAAPGGTVPPYAIVDVGGATEAEAGGAGGSTEFGVTGELWLTVLLEVDSDQSEADQDLTACNTLGVILADLLHAAGEADRLDITSLRVDPQRRPDEKLRASLGDFVQFDITITYRGTV